MFVKSFGRDKKVVEIKRRLLIFTIIVVVIFFMLMLRLWQLQVIRGKYFADLSVNNRIRKIRVKAPRGYILDRNGRILVRNRPSYYLVVVPEDINDNIITANFLESRLRIAKKAFLDILGGIGRKTFEPLILKRELSEQEVSVVEESKSEFPCLRIEVQPVRYYVNGKICAHVLGHLGEITKQQLGLSEYKKCRI